MSEPKGDDFMDFDLSDIPFGEPGEELEPPDPNRPEWEDGFQPPSVPTECWCLHCRQVLESYLMEYLEVPEMTGKHWVCPTPGCDTCGFGMDIWPTDPNWVDPDDRGISICVDDGEEEDEDEFYEESDPADWWKGGEGGEEDIPF